MKHVKRLGFLLIFLLCGMGFRYLLVDDTESYTRLMMHEFYRQDNIDVLFIGSSHCYISLDPRITDEIFQADTFNAGSALQAQDATFALIREAVERYQVKQIFMEMYYLMMNNVNYKDRKYLTETYIISDYMRPSVNKVRFLLNASSPKYYINSFIPPRRNWEALLHPADVIDIVKKKQTAEYRGYLPVNGYQGKGFAVNSGEIKNGLLLDTAGFDRIRPESASEDCLRTMNDIISYCDKKGIRLTLFSAPMSLFQTAGVGNYDDYIAMINEMIEGTNVRYVDFNICRERYFDQSPDLFSDAGHLNEAGAEKFSRLFADYFTGKIPDEELFYDSMAEKIAAHGPDLLGLSYLDSGDEMRKLKIVSTMPAGTLYDAEIIHADGTRRMLMEQSDDIFFEIPQDERGTVRITAGGMTVEIEE